VLVDLQHLDVVDCESESDRRQNERCSDPGLSRQRATEGLTGDHECSNVGDQREQDDDVSVDTVHESELLSDCRSELQDHKKSGRLLIVSISNLKDNWVGDVRKIV
jgi:hypothetical protein